MASGQFSNGDSDPDVVVANYFANTVMVLMGNGSGTFAAPVSILAGEVDGPLGVAVGDFDQDGSDDIAVASSGTLSPSTGRLVIGLNDGNGEFANPETYDIPGAPNAVAAADLNADTYLDLLVTDAVGDTLTVFLNQGTPGSGASTFQAATTFLQTGREPVAVAAGDFNGDGAADAVVVNREAATVKIYLGRNDGTLTLAETYLVGSDPRAAAVGDVDADGWVDLAIVNSGDDTVSVLRNRGGPTTP